MRRKNLFYYTGLALLASAAIGSSFSEAAMPSKEALAKFTVVSQLMQEKCMACHTKDYELPFYASIPGIKQIIEADYTAGLRAMNLNLELVEADVNKPINESTLAKMEWVILNETMPPAKFTAVNWGSRLSAKDKQDILDWVTENRALNYTTNTNTARANEPIQPIPAALEVDNAKVALGQALFNDKRLSTDNTISCASCHILDKGGVDGLRFSEGVQKQVGDINAPTVYNAVFHARQFWNGRATDLQDQAAGPPLNPIEMASKDWNEIITKLDADTEFGTTFKAVYPEGFTGDTITNAIAEYEKTLITPNSAFDKWLLGDDTALTAEEIEGYQRFKAYRCASCHVGVAMGGQSFEYMDLKKDYFADRGNPLGSDEGLRAFTMNEDDFRKFKVPTLRNVELTMPYLHDGTVQSLDQSVQIMGVYLSGMDIPEKDRTLIVAFLRTLTGEHNNNKLAGQAVAN